jgi:hypothetical protein
MTLPPVSAGGASPLYTRFPMLIDTEDHRLTAHERHVLRNAAERITGTERYPSPVAIEQMRAIKALLGRPDKWNTASAAAAPDLL